MDYEKKYKEALKRAKNYYSTTDSSSDIKLIGLIFPELNECEDERIIKAIKSAVLQLTDIYLQEKYGLKQSDCIAWLEKQGEQKPAKFDDTNAKLMFIKALERVEEQNAKGYKLTDCDKNSWWEDFKAFCSEQNLVNSAKTCKDEQDAAWSEKDKEKLDRIISLIHCYTGTVQEENELKTFLESLKNRVQPKREWCEEDEKMLNDILMCGEHHCYLDAGNITWLKSIKDKVQPQQKQEWSEEDSPYYDDICEILINLLCSETANVNKTAVQKDLDWLNSLKDRVKLQQKQEWSEEDYNEIETIACHLDNTDNEGLAEVLRNIRNKYYHIIPQSTWKPSDEQMEALEHFVRSIGESGYASPYDNDTKLLYSLLFDLKKLKEK